MISASGKQTREPTHGTLEETHTAGSTQKDAQTIWGKRSTNDSRFCSQRISKCINGENESEPEQAGEGLG